ncbi:hypothetical protein, partial [Streptomyces syringium]|uniref:hypothetical protein n=1 Tax=Streptomyces syringium TaxID=76729 RepID=UPI0033FF74D2
DLQQSGCGGEVVAGQAVLDARDECPPGPLAAPPAGRLAAGPAVGGGYRQILALWDRPQIVQTLLEGDLGFTA